MSQPAAPQGIKLETAAKIAVAAGGLYLAYTIYQDIKGTVNAIPEFLEKAGESIVEAGKDAVDNIANIPEGFANASTNTNISIVNNVIDGLDKVGIHIGGEKREAAAPKQELDQVKLMNTVISNHSIFTLGWRWCVKCSSLYDSTFLSSPRDCPAGGKHEPAGSYYALESLSKETPPTFLKNDYSAVGVAWVRCDRCACVIRPHGDDKDVYASPGGDNCKDGLPHIGGTTRYQMLFKQPGQSLLANQQGQWYRCKTCSSLIYEPSLSKLSGVCFGNNAGIHIPDPKGLGTEYVVIYTTDLFTIGKVQTLDGSPLPKPVTKDDIPKNISDIDPFFQKKPHYIPATGQVIYY